RASSNELPNAFPVCRTRGKDNLVIDAIFTAIRTVLIAASNVTSRLSSAAAVYQLEADPGGALDYSVMAWAGGGDSNDTQDDSFDVRLSIKAVSDSADDAGSIADAIRTALHGATLNYSGGWMHVRAQHLTPISYRESVDRATLHHKGGI